MCCSDATFDEKRDARCVWRSCGVRVSRCSFGILFGTVVGIPLTIAFIVLIALSHSRVDPNTMSIGFCKVSREVTGPYDEGMHSVCPDNVYEDFDRKFVDNSLVRLPCITADGLDIHLDLTTQYRIRREELMELYFEFGSQLELNNLINIIIQDTVRDDCSRFRGVQYYTDRGGVESSMATNVSKVIDASKAHVVTGFFQLENIALPAQLLSAITAKQLALENVQVAQNRRGQALIDAETRLQTAAENARINKIKAVATVDARVTKARADADTNIISGDANALAIVAVADQESAARKFVWNERVQAIVQNMISLNITSEQYVDNYLNPRLNAGVLSPEIIACLQESGPNSATAWWCWNHATPGIIP